jgi:hypothetical protein
MAMMGFQNRERMVDVGLSKHEFRTPKGPWVSAIESVWAKPGP